MTVIFILTFLLGAIIGSFLNVCIYRIPRGLSVVSPSSRCPSCGTTIKVYDNIPIISFFILGGRCRYCSGKIPLRYPLVETLNALMYISAVWRYGLGWQTPFLFAFCSSMIVITFIDIDFQIIPNVITLPGIVVGLVASSLVFPDPFAVNATLGFKEGMIGLLAGGGLFYFIAFVSQLILRQEAMGMGDVKMMAMVGAFMGWKAILLTTFAGSLIGSIVGILVMVLTGTGRKAKLPFGPFLAAGAILTLFVGQEIMVFYLHR
ncbi:MAG TPA: prepilin peptidase [Thermodesulfovibrionales bacterium]|jgi:leader peptidase (prepilin peptidase)/N-methyltransferase|nr:prepilin peptidase [Thermodesulfovibrionales bacterium]